MSLFTASSGHRAAACPASCALPRISSSSSYSDRGVGVHAFIRNVLAGAARSDALARVSTTYQDQCKAIDFSRLGGDLHDVRGEVAYVYHSRNRTVRFVGVNIGREYGPIADWEIPGTVDIEGRDYVGTPVVADTKTGQSVGPVEEHWQTKFHANIQAIIHHASTVEGRIFYVRQDGYVKPETHTFTRFELDTFADEVEEAYAAARWARDEHRAGRTLRVVQGDHCTYCESYASCPGNVALARMMLPDLRDLAVAEIAAMTPLQVGVVWEKLQRVKQLHETIKAGVDAYGRECAIQLEDGREVTMRTRNIDRFDAKAAIELLRAKGATAEEIGALYRSVEESAGLRAGPKPKVKVRAA